MEVTKFSKISEEVKNKLLEYCKNFDGTFCDNFEKIIKKVKIEGMLFIGIQLDSDTFISFNSERDFKQFEKNFFDKAKK